jgi:hypothetical protein
MKIKTKKPNSKTFNLISFVLFAVLIYVFACDSVTDNSSTSSDDAGDWLIPVDKIFDGGPGRDGIPALENPSFDPASGVSFLSDNELVIGSKNGNDVRAYPHLVLDYHEIINDASGGEKASITYCPLTGSGIAWNRSIDGATTTFGVSGLLYNTNLIPYDRASGSNWSQMLLKSVSGKHKGRKIETYPVVETSWATWKKMFPNSEVVSFDKNNSKPYGYYPYGNYKTSSRLIFPISNDDTRLHRKERVLGVILNEKAKAYRFDSFADSIRTINDQFKNVEIVVTGNKEMNFMVAYERRLGDGTLLTFFSLQNNGSVILMDNEGNKWNIFGEAVSGPRAGIVLKSPDSFIAYWFAWGTFYPGLEIFENN